MASDGFHLKRRDMMERGDRHCRRHFQPMRWISGRAITRSGAPALERTARRLQPPSLSPSHAIPVDGATGLRYTRRSADGQRSSAILPCAPCNPWSNVIPCLTTGISGEIHYDGSSSFAGRMQSTIATDNAAIRANAPKITGSETPRSRRKPKPQSAKPPQLMLTRFIKP